jgi:hypothetical protein
MNGDCLLVLTEKIRNSVHFLTTKGKISDNLTEDCIMLYHTAVTVQVKEASKYISKNAALQYTLEVIPLKKVVLALNKRKLKIVISELDRTKLWV